jgi:hypothetical protein
MSKDDADPLAKWRESEAAYAVAAKPFMKASNDARR